MQALESLVLKHLAGKLHLTLMQLQRGIQAVSCLESPFQLAAIGVLLRGGCWLAAMQVGGSLWQQLAASATVLCTEACLFATAARCQGSMHDMCQAPAATVGVPCKHKFLLCEHYILASCNVFYQQRRLQEVLYYVHLVPQVAYADFAVLSEVLLEMRQMLATCLQLDSQVRADQQTSSCCLQRALLYSAKYACSAAMCTRPRLCVSSCSG
jgi:hypothetical protein